MLGGYLVHGSALPTVARCLPRVRLARPVRTCMESRIHPWLEGRLDDGIARIDPPSAVRNGRACGTDEPAKQCEKAVKQRHLPLLHIGSHHGTRNVRHFLALVVPVVLAAGPPVERQPIAHSPRPIGACACQLRVRCICTERGPFTECPAVLAMPSSPSPHPSVSLPPLVAQEPASPAPLYPRGEPCQKGENASPPFPTGRSNEKTPSIPPSTMPASRHAGLCMMSTTRYGCAGRHALP